MAGEKSPAFCVEKIVKAFWLFAEKQLGFAGLQFLAKAAAAEFGVNIGGDLYGKGGSVGGLGPGNGDFPLGNNYAAAGAVQAVRENRGDGDTGKTGAFLGLADSQGYWKR